MDIDLDKKLYNDYLNGKVEAYEALYLKYKDKIRFFIFNIIKDYEKAEDITQDVFIDILKNKFREDGSFKYYIYLLAKSKALNYLNTEKRRKDITEKYLEGTENEKDALEIITKNEEKKELLEAISMLDEKYRNVMHLAKIEEFSYQETAEILNISIQDVKNNIHRGKKELHKILIKKGFSEMNKVSKVLVILICISVALSGIVYATMKIYENMKEKANLTPVFTGKIGDTDYNSIWIGTFNLAWNELMDKYIGGNVEFELGNTELVDELNKQSFKKDQLSEKDYYIKTGKTSEELKNQILQDIKNKFNIENSEVLEKIDFKNAGDNSFTIYSILSKSFEFPIPFDRLGAWKFGESEKVVDYFGINNSSEEELNDNLEVLFYNSFKDFSVKLKAKEKEEIILYRTDENKSFDEYYKEIENKSNSYGGNKKFAKGDELKIPYIYVDTIINYDELCGKFIKDQDALYIQNAIQNVKFVLSETGGRLTSEAAIKGEENLVELGQIRKFDFDDTFVIFLKEQNSTQPYMSLKVDNADVLLKY